MTDFPNGVNSPGAASYTSPLLDFSPIGGLVQDYAAGTKARSEIGTANAFRNGIPKTEAGLPNYGAMAETLAKAGNVAGAMPFLNMGLQQQFGLAADDAIAGKGPAPQAGGQTTTASPARSQQAGGSTAVQPNQSSAPTRPQSQQGAPSTGGNTLMDVIAANGVPDDRAGYVASTIAKRLNIDPNAPLDPALAENVARQIIAAKGGAPAASPTTPRPSPAAGLVPENWRGREQEYANYLSRRAAAIAMVNPKAAEEMRAVAKVVFDAIAKGAEPTNDMKNADASGQPNPLEYNVSLENRKTTPAQKEWGQDRLPGESLAAYEARRAGDKKLAEVGAENTALTPDQKNLRQTVAGAPSAAQQITDLKTRGAVQTSAGEVAVKAFDKEYTGLQQLEHAAFNGSEKARLGKGLVNDVNFYSGPLEPTVRAYQQFKSVFGANPGSAVPQEAFQKVVTDMLTEQIKALGGSGVGRVLQVEVQNMQKSIASLGVTAATNRVLLETVDRVYQQAKDLGAIARHVAERTRNNPGAAQNELNDEVSNYYQGHPLFSAAERSDPRIIGAPDVPIEIRSPQQVTVWAQRLGLPKGYPVKWNGQLGSVP